MSEETPQPPANVVRHLKEEPRRKAREGAQWLAIALILLSFTLASVYFTDKLQASFDQTNANATKLDTVNKLLEQQTKQFEYCKKAPKGDPRCQQPVVPPVTITPERPESPSNQKALSVEEVRAVAQSVAAETKWRPTSADYDSIARIAYSLIPKQPTQAQIQNMLSATVASYCANDKCKGEKGKDAPTITPAPGKDGTPGQPGSDSTIPGPPGKDATDEQVAASVAAWCSAHNDCKGDEGRGLASLTCRDDGKLVAIYTKPDAAGNTRQVIEDSSCKVPPPPTVTVTETETETVTPEPPEPSLPITIRKSS